MEVRGILAEFQGTSGACVATVRHLEPLSIKLVMRENGIVTSIALIHSEAREFGKALEIGTSPSPPDCENSSSLPGNWLQLSGWVFRGLCAE